MIEEGKTYKLKKIKDFFGTNTEDDFKVLKIVGDTVYSQNQETKEPLMCNIKDFIDPEHPDDIYSDIEIVMEKLESVMKPMNLSFWKDLQEEATCGSLGAAPCPAMGQITGGNISGCMVNGVPVEGKSRKKKKKAKNEELEAYIQELLEDFNEEYEEITEQIAKYLDRLNFEFANTEEIIYKKEGENKYLFKFDNEIGVIKIKVLHGDEVLVEKEYEVDDTEDIQPIFDEIESIYKEYGL